MKPQIMKIALLTCACSTVIECLGRIIGSEDFVVIDFSTDNILADACRNMHIMHMRFSSWKQIEEHLSGFDLLMSYKLNKIIPMDIVCRFRFGGVNIHPSLLPKYPGANPWFQMYCNMDLDAGVTIHKITERPDSGNIIAQQSFRLEPGQPLPVAMRNADDIAVHLITDVIVGRLFLNLGAEQDAKERPSLGTIDLMSLKLLTVDRLWHILRGFPELISTLYPELPHKYFEVGEYIRQPGSETRTGITERGDGRRWITCNDGIISLWDFSDIPMTQDYIDAVAARDFIDVRLRKASFEKNIDGSLSFVQGREAIVFLAIISSEKFAVRFPRNMPWTQTAAYTGRLVTVGRHLHKHGVKHFAEFEVLPEAVRLPKGVFPALMMKWYSGDTLMAYLSRHLHDYDLLASLLRRFKTVCSINHRTGIVHGDIHSANIIVDRQGNISILDIDGIWIPAFGQMKDNGGNRNWQHPLRMRNEIVTERVDYFAEMIVCATIYVAIYAPDVFKLYSDGESLFRENDYSSSSDSQLLSELSKNFKCEPVVALVSKISSAHSLDEIPKVEKIKLFDI